MSERKAAGVLVVWSGLAAGCVGEGASPLPSLVVMTFILLALLVVWRTDPRRWEGRA